MATENPIASLPAADADTLVRIAGCEAVDLLLPDTNGVLRGKRVTAEALSKVYRDGVCLPMSLIATDITGNTVEETGLGYAIGDADRICRPIEGSLRPVPWAPRPMAQLLLAMHTPEGGLFDVAPRAVLQRVLQGFGALGLNPVIAVELEFYLFDAVADAQGARRRRATRSPANATTAPRCIRCRIWTTSAASQMRSQRLAGSKAFRPTLPLPNTRPASSKSICNIAPMR